MIQTWCFPIEKLNCGESIFRCWLKLKLIWFDILLIVDVLALEDLSCDDKTCDRVLAGDLVFRGDLFVKREIGF